MQLNFNASLLGDSGCLCKLHYIHNLGLYTTEDTYKMDYGTAFHKFRAAYRSGKSILDSRRYAFEFFATKCLKVPEGDFRTIDHLHKVTELYPEKFPRESDPIKPRDTNSLELAFMYPLEIFLDTFTYKELYDLLGSNKVIICGTLDELGIRYEEQLVVDCKVTARWDKEKVMDGYRLDTQMLFYSWVARKIGLSKKWLPVIVDGVFIKNPTLKQKDRLTGKLVATNGWNGVSFQRSEPIDFNDEIMESFEQQLVYKLKEIAQAMHLSKYHQNFNECNTVYGACQFRSLCLMHSSKRNESINRLFQTRLYEPWKFQN